MKTIPIIILLFIFNPKTYGQNTDQSIYATTNKNVNLFFASPITSAIVGSTTYSFGFNKEDKSTYGILKAFPGPESNLLITTENGNVFSFIIKYKKEIGKLNYFIGDSLAIGNTNGNIQVTDDASGREIQKIHQAMGKISSPVRVNDFETSPGQDTHAIVNVLTSEYEENCKKEIDKEPYFLRFYNSSNKVFLKLKNIVYKDNNMYFSIVIENDSNLDYDVENISFYISARNKSKKTSTQRIVYEPVYIYQEPSRIDTFSRAETVYVFKKFSINKEKLLVVSLTENKGERNIYLEIPNLNINNPN